MKNIDLLLEYNKDEISIEKAKKGFIIYNSKSKIINGDEIRNIIRFINSVNNRYKKIKIPLILKFSKVVFIDKLTYIILECLVYYMNVRMKHQLQVNINLEDKNTNIFTEGIMFNSLYYINGKYSKEKLQIFIEKFTYDLYGRHFRKILDGNIDVSSDNTLGKLMNDIRLFLIFLDVPENDSTEIAETVTELVGNAIEHTKTDCLVDIDVTESYVKRDEDKSKYYGINIVVINFSETLFEDFLKTKLKNEKLELNDRYKDVTSAYYIHERNFSPNYKEDDFYKIASFQHGVSGSDNKLVSGGKGLTQLIKSLEIRSDSHKCYLMSGYGIVNFKHRFLNFNDEDWIGFNKENDFLRFKPESECIDKSKVYFPGTAYNLNFAMRKEEKHEEK